MATNDAWTRRWICSAIVQGAILAAVTFVLFLYGSEYLVPSPSMVMVSTSAGLWIVIGYLLYIIMIVAFGVTGLFYHYLENIGRRLTGGIAGLAWIQLVLMNVGVIGTTFLLMYAGYIGGSALIPTQQGGGGLTVLQVHVQLLQYYPLPVIAFVVATLIGALCGGAVFARLLLSRRGK